VGSREAAAPLAGHVAREHATQAPAVSEPARRIAPPSNATTVDSTPAGLALLQPGERIRRPARGARVAAAAVFALAGLVLLAGCGSGKAKPAAQATTRPSTTPAPRPHRARPRPTIRPKAASGKGTQQAGLAWIRNLQRDLASLHFYGGPVTGVETGATRSAVIRFQRAEHLKPDGLWGPKSQTALERALHR